MGVSIDTGLLVIRGNSELVRSKMRRLLELAVTRVHRKLYVHLEERESLKELLPAIYLSAASLDTDVDLRVLIDKRTIKVDRVFYDEVKDPDYPAFPMLKENNVPFDLTYIIPPLKKHQHIILGGTFDRLHNGHKMLLSEAILRAKKKITCGITDGKMNEKKVLWELIEPVSIRCKNVVDFVEDVSEGVECIAVPIYDPYGPSIIGNDYNEIIVSEETAAGANAVNAERKKSKLNPLEIHIVKLLESDGRDNVLGETKISSSVKRRQILGTIISEPDPTIKSISSNHYVIGLTGGIASGKTHIAKYLAVQGCEVIDCDALVHKLYTKSEELRKQLSTEFGTVIIVNECIDRKILAEVVFGDKYKLKRLNEIVWPFAEKFVIEAIRNSAKEIVIIDAALLIEAGWDKFTHQIWTVFIPQEEALKRICARDKISIEQASARIANQLPNKNRIARSNVVFSSIWDYSETERQVQKALDIIKRDYVSKALG